MTTHANIPIGPNSPATADETAIITRITGFSLSSYLVARTVYLHM